MGCGASAEPAQVPDKYTPAAAETEIEVSPGDRNAAPHHRNAAPHQPAPEKAAPAVDSAGDHAAGTPAEQCEEASAVEPAAETTDAGWATVVCEDGRQYCESLPPRDDGH